MPIDRGINFGINTDSFFEIGFGLIRSKNVDLLTERAGYYFNLLNRYGIDINNIEINTEIEQLSPGFLDRVIFPLFRSYGVKSASIHAPYIQLNPASPLEGYRKFSSDAMIKTMKAAGGIDVNRFVIHLTSSFEDSIPSLSIPEDDKKALERIAVSQARKSLDEILKKTGVEPERLALENLEVFPFEMIYPLVSEFGISICFDMGHWGLNGFAPQAFMERFSPVSEIHIQDMSEERRGLRTTIRKEHLPLGTGILKVVEFFNYLGEKFNSEDPLSLILENRSLPDLVKSLDFLKEKGFLS